MTRHKLAYAQHISLSVVAVGIALHAVVSHRLNCIPKIFYFMSQLKGALSSAQPAETWEVAADDTPKPYRPLGERPAGGASLR